MALFRIAVGPERHRVVRRMDGLPRQVEEERGGGGAAACRQCGVILNDLNRTIAKELI